jgi:lipoyl(octanoyl) transferase
LHAYLLGQVEFESALALQRRLAYEVAGGEPSCLLVCEHAPIITIGRHGSRFHLHCEPEDLYRRRWPVRWVNRGGGCWLQIPGQVTVYPILPLERLNLTLGAYLRKLRVALASTLEEFAVPATLRDRDSAVWVHDRPIACVGVAVREWVSYHGAILNVNPALDVFRAVRTGEGHPPMTSLQRECRQPVRSSQVRERVLHHFANLLGFAQVHLFSDHPFLSRKAVANAIAATR